MKKILMVLLAAMVVFGFTACDESTPAPSDVKTSEVVAYFNNFATKHIFGEINTALNAENKSTDEISNLSAVFTEAVTDDPDTDDVNEAAPAKIVFTYTATDMRYNGEIEEGGTDKTNHRLVNGNITLTVTGTVSGETKFTAKDFTFAGTDLRLTDAQTGKDYETLPVLTVDIKDFAVDFVAGKEADITLEKEGTGDDAVLAPVAIEELKANSADLAQATGSVVVKPNNISYDFSQIVALIAAAQQQ